MSSKNRHKPNVSGEAFPKGYIQGFLAGPQPNASVQIPALLVFPMINTSRYTPSAFLMCLPTMLAYLLVSGEAKTQIVA